MTYSPHAPHLKNPHLHTLLAAMRADVSPPAHIKPERITLADGDFLDLDWHPATLPSDRLVIISHGLEGHSKRPYVLGMARAANSVGVDALAWSCRGCSGVPNALPRLYHCGVDDDLGAVVDHAVATGRYKHITLVGFSMGGNITLLYLGRRREHVPPQVTNFAAVATPCDLNDSISTFERPAGLPYTLYFLRSLRKKIHMKAKQLPDHFDTRPLSRITSLRAYDDAYTAPLHGFDGAVDYWTRSSSRQYIPYIDRPGLILNALDDPFLTGGCFPYQEVAENPHVELITPAHGGHVGFLEPGSLTWAERTALTRLVLPGA